jgi:anti-anti-sigma factor
MEESHVGLACVLSISGRISSGDAANLLDRLNKLLLSGEKMILLDFKEVLFLTSATFRVLLVATKEAEQNAARVALCGVLGQIREVFEMSGLLGVFNIHATREEALAHWVECRRRVMIRPLEPVHAETPPKAVRVFSLRGP